MIRKAASGGPWIAGAAGVVVQPHSSGGDWHHGTDAAGTVGVGSSQGRELIVARREIHIVPGGPQDWIVRADDGRELGHYPSREAALAVGHKLAQRHAGELLVFDGSGKVEARSRPSRSWLGRMFGR